MVDLWPENLDKPTFKSPVTILREQASLLGSKTNNVVEANVSRLKSVWWASESEFAYGFYIVAPLLKGYRYKLFSLSHTLELYPVKVEMDDEIKKELRNAEPPLTYSNNTALFLAASEDELLRMLGLIFKAEKTVRVIHALLAQSETESTS